MLVSVVVSAFNEEKYLPGLIDDFKKQTYPHSLIEIILINAMSTDSSKKIMETFRDSDEEFYSVKVLDNVKKTQPSGFNLGVKNASGDVILKVDAHSKISENFIVSFNFFKSF